MKSEPQEFRAWILFEVLLPLLGLQNRFSSHCTRLGACLDYYKALWLLTGFGLDTVLPSIDNSVGRLPKRDLVRLDIKYVVRYSKATTRRMKYLSLVVGLWFDDVVTRNETMTISGWVEVFPGIQ